MMHQVHRQRVNVPQPTAGVRAYLRELRIRQKITQPALAHAMGIALRTLSDWERGHTDDLKSAQLFRAVRFLHGSLDDIDTLYMLEADETTGIAHAAARVEAHEQRINRLLADDSDHSFWQELNRLRTELNRLEERIKRRDAVGSHPTDG